MLLGFFLDRRLLIELFWTFCASHLYCGSRKVAHTSLLGASCLLLRHKQMLQIAENANKMLAVISVCSRKSWVSITHQSAMLSPQIDFISMHVLFDVPIQLL